MLATVSKLPNTEIYDEFQNFLLIKERRSESTREAYEHDIKQFFLVIKNKEIYFVNEDDLVVTVRDLENFQESLINLLNDKSERINSNKTINRKISALHSFIKHMIGRGYKADVGSFQVLERLPEVTNSYDVFEHDEVFKVAEWVANNEKFKSKMKEMMILFSFDTCARLSECLEIRWDNFVEKSDHVQIRLIGKGNKEFKPKISKDFYNMLLGIKVEGQDRLFDLSKDNVKDMMGRIKKGLNIPKHRKIVFHSIRKAGVSFVYDITGSIYEAMKAANHSNPSTTQIYMRDKDTKVTGAVSLGYSVDKNLYKKVDHDTLIEAIGNLSTEQILCLNVALSKLNCK